MRTLKLFIAAALVPLAVASPGTAGALTQDPCGGPVTVSAWKQLGTDVLENLLFADGSMWVSDGGRSAVVRLAPNGAELPGVPGIPSPGGLAQGPDGKIYAGWGNSFANALSRNGAARVVRFDPAAPGSSLEVVASGFNMPNGMTFGPGGALFVSNDVDHGLLRIDTETGEWAEFAHVWGANGLVVRGGTMYAAITFDQRSPIARISLENPADVDHDIQLSAGVVSLEPAVHEAPASELPLLGVKGLDDMTLGPDDTLYVVANGTGELLRVSPDTGEACLVASGLQNPSSVRVAPEGGPFADGDPATVDLFVTEFSGAIRRVHLGA